MKIFLRCFGCKKQSKKNKISSNNSNVKFRSFVNQEANFPNNNSLNLVKQTDKHNEIKNQNNNDNSSQQNKKEILISVETQIEKNKITDNPLITEEAEKNENKENLKISKFGLNLNKEIGFEEPLLKTDSPLISTFEKNMIFTKSNLIEQFDKFWNLDKYKKIWDKDNLIIEIRSEGSEINNEFHLIKILYRQNKSAFKENFDIQTLIDFLYIPSLRLKWDKFLKKLEVLDGNIEFNYVISSLAKPPVFLMSQRESVEKRFIFKGKEGKSIYVMSSSVPDNLFPDKDDVVKITNFINYYKLVDEGDFIEFYSLNQTDFKMPIPQFLINVTLPTTTKNWQTELEKFAYGINYDRNAKTIIQNNNEKLEKK